MNLADWSDLGVVTARLVERGMSVGCAADAAECFAECAATLARTLAPDSPVIACWAPGRVEVLGKHTDYCGGSSILAAVERGFAMLAVPREDNTIDLLNVRAAERCDFALDTSIEPPLGHWSNYPQTVARRIARNFSTARRGATIAFVSNLPQASGMSSSSAFVVGTFLLLSKINNLPEDPAYKSAIHNADELAGYLGSIENGGGFGSLAGDRGVGTFGGSEDHVAILRARPNALVRYSYCPVRFEEVIDLDPQFTFAVASSGVVAEKTGEALEKYNRVSKLATAIVDLWRAENRFAPTTLAAILRESPEVKEKLIRTIGKDSHPEFSCADLLGRLEHFEIESHLQHLGTPRYEWQSAFNEWDIGPSLNSAIDSDSLDHLQRTARRSQQAGIRLLHNQVPETIRLAELAEEFGAHGGSAFGAGFGGSVWALVDQSNAVSFLAAWRARYLHEFPQHAPRCEFLLTRPGVPAFVT